jgi:PqqD family protein of HPr-rel-A system
MDRGARRREDVPWVEVDGDVVAVTPSGEIHVLRGAVAALWQLLDGAPLTGLDEVVAETFGVDRDEARGDIETSLRMLDRIGIVDAGTG